MPDPNAQHLMTGAEIALPGLAGAGGAMVAAAFGPPRSTRQHSGDVGAAGLSMILVGPWLCGELGVESATSNSAAAMYAITGFFGPIFLRAVLAIADEVSRQIEAGKSETAKTIVKYIGWRWFRQEEPPSPPKTPKV